MKLQLAISVSLLSAAVTNANIGRGVSGHVKRDANLPYGSGIQHRRAHADHHPHMAPRATPSSEAQEATITSASEACTPYSLDSVNALIPKYPTVWEVADLLSNDTQAVGIMKAINASGIVPANIEPRGTAPASYSGTGTETGYNSNTDPDCYWTATECTKPKHAGILEDITTCDEPHTWGYTFDDGPNCTQNALYDTWTQLKQKASLMYIGSNVMDWPLQAQRGITDGHHICVHVSAVRGARTGPFH